MTGEVQVSAMLVDVGVNMGDHAETTSHAVEVSRDETVGEVVDRLLTQGRYVSPFQSDDRVAAPLRRLELRAIESAEVSR